jgi:hypothetical protein
MNFAGNFIHIGNLDVAALQQQVLSLSEQRWQGEAFRQQRYEVHRDTQTIPLVFDPDFRHTHPTKLPALREFESLIRPALKMAADHFDDSPKGWELFEEHGMGYFVRANLVRLKSGGEITQHTDNNFSLVHSHRVHLPVVTNTEVAFTVGNETINMKEGALYEINNRRMHSVRNAGAEARVHLILDYVIPGEKCCCGEKLHPLTACNPQACKQTDHLEIECVCFQAL